jgi:hypothetical protein
MKKDIQQRSGVSQGSTRVETMGHSTTAGEARRDPSKPRQFGAVPAQPSLSARYIDSRLKQFCLR